MTESFIMLDDLLESAAGRSHARSSVFGKNMRVVPDRMEGGRTKRRKSERERDDGSKAKEPFVAAERRLIRLADLLEGKKTSGFGFDMAVRMGVHGVGTSPSASGDPQGRGRFTFHVPPGGTKVVIGDPLAKPKRDKKKRRRK